MMTYLISNQKLWPLHGSNLHLDSVQPANQIYQYLQEIHPPKTISDPRQLMNPPGGEHPDPLKYYAETNQAFLNEEQW